MNTDLPSTSTSNMHSHVDHTTQTEPDHKVTVMRRQIKTLKQKVRRKNLKISTMKDVIREISSSGYNNENLNTVLKNYFEGKGGSV